MDIKTKFVFTFILIALFSISFVSAAEWDNCKEVSDDKKEVKIKDNCLLGFDVPFITNEIATITLDTKLDERVGAGYGKVAQFTVYSKKDYNNAMSLIEFYDKKEAKNNNRHFMEYETNVDFEYKRFDGYSNITHIKYDTICEDAVSTNGTEYENCYMIENGSYIETVEDWSPLISKDFKEDTNITIGIFTHVKARDNYEWIPTFAGQKVPQWAEWTADLNVGLKAYWKLDNNILTDSLGVYNLTNGGTVNSSGIIKSSRAFTSDILTSAPIPVPTDMTIIAWINATTASGTDTIIVKKPVNDQWFTFLSDGVPTFRGGSTGSDLACNKSVAPGVWSHVAFLIDGTNGEIFVNGTVCAIGTINAIGNSNTPTTNDVLIGDYGSGSAYFDGDIDEVMIANRTWTPDEVTQSFNSGVGISWTDQFGKALPTAQLLSPDDNTLLIFNDTIESQNFQCNGSSAVGVTELELFINGTLFDIETNVSVAENLTINFNADLPAGNFTWFCQATNLNGADNSTTRTLKAKRLTILLDSPEDNFLSEINSVIFNYSLDNANTNIANTTLYIDGVANVTNSSGTPGFYSFNVTNLEFASHTYSILAIDTNNTIYNNVSRSFAVSTFILKLPYYVGTIGALIMIFSYAAIKRGDNRGGGVVNISGF